MTWAGDVSVAQTGTKTLTLGGIAERWVQNEVSGVISDNPAVQALVSLVKTGSATWRLTGQNTYRGTTSVQQGALQVGHGGDGTTLAQARAAGTTGTGRTTLSSGGVLSGTGVIQTGLTIQGGEVSPGDSSLATEETPFVAGGQVGTLWVDGDVAFESGTLTFQVKSATVQVAGLADPAGSGYAAALAGLPASHAPELSAAVNQTGLQHDHLEITGAFNATSTGPQTLQIVAVEGATFSTGDVFNLIDWAGLAGQSAFAVVPTFVLPDLSGINLTWDTSLFATDGILVVTSVPEPARGLLLTGGLGLLLRRRRARRDSPR